MSLRFKILLAIALCMLTGLGSFIIINKIFQNLETALYEKCGMETRFGAKASAELMTAMLERKTISVIDLFDTNYREIANSNPKKYNTRYDGLFDQVFQKFEDEFLLDPDVEYAVLIDKNGYVPTHNTRYSRPLTGSPSRDIVFSRTKRIFSSYEGIRNVLAYSGRFTAKSLYKRDTGEIIWNIASPIFIDGKKWGSFLIGVSLERIDRIKLEMLTLTIITMFIIMAITLLAILLITPRKYSDKDISV
jgi:hypothetical protein